MNTFIVVIYSQHSKHKSGQKRERWKILIFVIYELFIVKSTKKRLLEFGCQISHIKFLLCQGMGIIKKRIQLTI